VYGIQVIVRREVTVAHRQEQQTIVVIFAEENAKTLKKLNIKTVSISLYIFIFYGI